MLRSHDLHPHSKLPRLRLCRSAHAFAAACRLAPCDACANISKRTLRRISAFKCSPVLRRNRSITSPAPSSSRRVLPRTDILCKAGCVVCRNSSPGQTCRCLKSRLRQGSRIKAIVRVAFESMSG